MTVGLLKQVYDDHRAGVSEDGMGGAAASLGDGAVAGEDAGLLAAALTSAGRETTSSPAEQEGAPRRRFLRREEGEGFTRVRSQGSRQRTGREQAENSDEGDLSPDMESPTWIHHKPTAVLTALQNGAAFSLPPETGK
ncbi:hypothetical protein CRENBAI_014887 [Crenichthys baileyi]|uniref:Uncharacterized protein n=1 Tax=Crenichthys baileyi TaxID=28760 RepID=A0AAV9SC60_9TELE